MATYDLLHTDTFANSWQRFLLFKLVLMSGVVKITSKDRVWQQLTALYYHFASQPLPTPVSWYFRQLHPLALQLGVAFTFLVEIPLAFMILCPLRVVRHWTAALQAALQLLIMLTGNYGYFNVLTLVLIVTLLDDRYSYRDMTHIRHRRHDSYTVFQCCYACADRDPP